jgi:hypothetical protein
LPDTSCHPTPVEPAYEGCCPEPGVGALFRSANLHPWLMQRLLGFGCRSQSRRAPRRDVLQGWQSGLLQAPDKRPKASQPSASSNLAPSAQPKFTVWAGIGFLTALLRVVHEPNRVSEGLTPRPPHHLTCGSAPAGSGQINGGRVPVGVPPSVMQFDPLCLQVRHALLPQPRVVQRALHDSVGTPPPVPTTAASARRPVDHACSRVRRRNAAAGSPQARQG